MCLLGRGGGGGGGQHIGPMPEYVFTGEGGGGGPAYWTHARGELVFLTVVVPAPPFPRTCVSQSHCFV